MPALKPPKAVWGGGTVSTALTAWGVGAKRPFQLTSKPVPLRSQAQRGWARCHPTFRGCFQNAVQQPEAGGDRTTEVREIDGELSSCKVRLSFKQKLVWKRVLSTAHVSGRPEKSTKSRKWHHNAHFEIFEITPWPPRSALFQLWGSDNKLSVIAKN